MTTIHPGATAPNQLRIQKTPFVALIKYSLEKNEKTSSTTQASTVSTVTDSNSPAGAGHQTTRETA
eukprot:15326654-Ditylum_brightwellii.AAC.1